MRLIICIALLCATLTAKMGHHQNSVMVEVLSDKFGGFHGGFKRKYAVYGRRVIRHSPPKFYTDPIEKKLEMHNKIGLNKNNKFRFKYG